MIRIHMLAFLAVLELTVVFAGLWLVWFFKSRKLARQYVAARARLARPETVQSVPNAAAYFAEEIVATHAQMDAGSAADAEVPSEALALRAAYLELERELAQGQQRDADFWANARQRVGELLAQYAAPAVPVTQDEAAGQADSDGDQDEVRDDMEKDPQRVKNLIDMQVSTISELKQALAKLVGEREEGPQMLDQVDKLGRTNRELAMCVSILEDDNNLLREKLKEAGLITD